MSMLPFFSEPQNSGGNLGPKDDIKDEIGGDCRDQSSKDRRLPALGFHDLEEEADEEKGVDEKTDPLKGKGISDDGCQDDDDTPPSKWLRAVRFFFFFFTMD